MTGEPLWTVSEAAEYLSMSTSWIYKKVSEGEFPHLKLGRLTRFVPEQVRQYAAATSTAKPSGAPVIPLRGRGR